MSPESAHHSPSRGRATDALRRLAAETEVSPDHLILPLFVVPGRGRREAVKAMPGVERLSADLLPARVEPLAVPAVLLFGVPDERRKDDDGKLACRHDGLVPKAVKALKKSRPDLAVITDACLCAWTRHGHCGILNDRGGLDLERTRARLGEIAVAHAAAGADMVAPSAMADGQVAAIRRALDAAGHPDAAIMGYAAKFASALYGPFRDAARSAPAFGDRRAYQLPPSNAREAVRDALLDEAEGADWLMVKPATLYLDVVHALRAATRLPIAAYHVSGEYAMIKRAAAAGALDERQVVLESVLSARRAGADAVITYFAEDICRWIGR